MSEATIILQNMRGGCATVDGKVHTLFRVSRRRLGPAESKRKFLSPDTEWYFQNYYSMRTHHLEEDRLSLDPGR